MKLFCFDHNKGKNESGKKLYKRKTPKATSLTDVGNVADWVDHLGSGSGELAWEKKDRRTAEGLGPLKATVDTKQRLNKVRERIDRERGKPTFRERKDVFGTIECQKWYLRHVRESLESLEMGDKLHDFIMAHKKYGMGDHLRWNSEFAVMIDLKPKPPQKYKGPNKATTYRRIAVAAQQVMVDHFNSENLFKLVSANGWDKEDGKVGPYTTRVLREYWRDVHSKTSKRGMPDASELARGYQKNGPNAKKFAAAVAGLAALMAVAKPDLVIPGKKTPPEKVLADKILGGAERIKKKYANLDKKGDAVKLNKLAIRHHDVKKDHTGLLPALAEAFGEKPNPNNPEKSPRLYRALHLLALADASNVDRVKVKKGDILKISSEGVLTVLMEGNRIRYTKKMKKPKTETA